jgi:hypothetical protein
VVLQTITDAALIMTVALTGRLLRGILRQYDGIAESLRPVDWLPRFCLPSLGSPGRFCRRHLANTACLLMIADPVELDGPNEWARMLGSLRVLARRHQAREILVLTSTDVPPGLVATSITVLIDQDRLLSNRLKVARMPTAYLFGNDHRFVTVGRMARPGEGDFVASSRTASSVS